MGARKDQAWEAGDGAVTPWHRAGPKEKGKDQQTGAPVPHPQGGRCLGAGRAQVTVRPLAEASAEGQGQSLPVSAHRVQLTPLRRHVRWK